MFGLFKCTHPFSKLGVSKEHTKEIKCEDFEHIHYHLYCRQCGKELVLSHAKIIGSVQDFMDRGRQEITDS